MEEQWEGKKLLRIKKFQVFSDINCWTINNRQESYWDIDGTDCLNVSSQCIICFKHLRVEESAHMSGVVVTF